MAVVLFSEQPDAFALSALRAGACDVVHSHTLPEELGRVLQRAAQGRPVLRFCPAGPRRPRHQRARRRARAGHQRPGPQGRRARRPWPPNLAVAWPAPRCRRSRWTWTCSSATWPAPSTYPDHTLLGIVTAARPRATRMVPKTFLTQHETGLYAVCGPHQPRRRRRHHPRRRSACSRPRCRVPPRRGGHRLGLGEHARRTGPHQRSRDHDLSPDVPGVRGLRKELDILRDLGLLIAATW